MQSRRYMFDAIRESIKHRGYKENVPVLPIVLNNVIYEVIGDSVASIRQAWITWMVYSDVLADGGDGIVWLREQ